MPDCAAVAAERDGDEDVATGHEHPAPLDTPPTLAANGQATDTSGVLRRWVGVNTNAARVTAGVPYPNAANNSDTETTTVTPR